MQNAPQTKWVSTNPIFLLEIFWGGGIYRFSSKPIVVVDGTKSYQFNGGLPTPEISIQMETGGLTGEGESIPFQLVFPVDISAQMAKDVFLDGSIGELSYIFEKSEKPVESYNDRYVIFKGIVSEPIYGHPDKPTGYVEFSLEERVFIEELDLLDAVVGTGGRLDVADLSNEEKAASSPLASITVASMVNVSDVHKGKRSPFVLGRTKWAYSQTTFTPRDNIATPAYLIGVSASGLVPGYLMVAGHLVDASNLKIYDSKGNSDTGSVLAWVNSNNEPFSMVEINNWGTSTPLANVLNDENIEYWAAWDTGGGFINPWGTGSMEGGGDIILYLLSLVTNDLDYDSFFGARYILNQYKFGGYVNEAISPISFIENHILPFLPCSIGIGPKGLKPILDLSIFGDYLTPSEKITSDSSFFRISPLETSNDYSSIINQLDFSYGFNGIKNRFQSIRIIPQKRNARWFEFSTDYSRASHQQFGLRSSSISADYIYDYGTAIQSAKDIIKKNHKPERKIIYKAAPNWGYLWVGDIIELTDDSIGLEKKPMQIIGKKWDGTSWEYELKMGI